MAGIIPLIFSRSRRTPEEEEKLLQEEKLKYGQFLEDLGKIYHVKSWIEMMNDYDNSSYANKIFLISNRWKWQQELFSKFTNDTFSDFDEERCKWCFTEYSRCLDITARQHGQDPLTTDTMTETVNGADNCAAIQELTIQHCNHHVFKSLAHHRRRELKLARFRRLYLSTFANLKEDWGMKRYPDYILKQKNENVSVLNAIKNFSFRDLLKFDKSEYLEAKDDKRIDLAEYSENVWPEEKMSEKQKEYIKHRESFIGESPHKIVLGQFKNIKKEKEQREKENMKG